MATKAQIKAAAQSFVAQQLGTIIPVQNQYFNKGIHFQGINTPDIPPDDGATVVPDLSKKPTDQAESWADMFTGPTALPGAWNCQMQIDVYDGPLGKGWTLTGRATKLPTVMSKVWNFGPETWRETDWVETEVSTGPQPFVSMRGMAADALAAEEVVDKLVGVKRPWYVRFILWIWRWLLKIRG